MKQLTFIFLSLAITSSSIAQGLSINVVDGPCEGYEIIANNINLENSGNCFHFPETEFANDGDDVTLSIQDRANSALNGVSSLDLVEIARILLDMQSVDDQNLLNEMIYKADIDQDGAVSTYDFVLTRANILGLSNEFPAPNHHLIEATTTIPNLDPFDIQVNYAELTYQFDFNNQATEIKVLKLGDLNNSGL